MASKRDLYMMVGLAMVIGYFLGAVLWKYLWSMNAMAFLIGAVVYVFGMALAYEQRRYTLIGAFFGALIALFTATYWIVGLF